MLEHFCSGCKNEIFGRSSFLFSHWEESILCKVDIKCIILHIYCESKLKKYFDWYTRFQCSNLRIRKRFRSASTFLMDFHTNILWLREEVALVWLRLLTILKDSLESRERMKSRAQHLQEQIRSVSHAHRSHTDCENKKTVAEKLAENLFDSLIFSCRSWKVSGWRETVSNSPCFADSGVIFVNLKFSHAVCTWRSGRSQRFTA